MKILDVTKKGKKELEGNASFQTLPAIFFSVGFWKFFGSAKSSVHSDTQIGFNTSD